MADSLNNRRKKEEPRRLPGMKVAPPSKNLGKEALLDAYQQATPEERRQLRAILRRKFNKEA